MMPKKAALFYEYPIKDGEVFGQGRRQTIENPTDLYPEELTQRISMSMPPILAI